ncbi:MAG: thiamine-phosphate kinase [Alteromonadaceae bacterium]|nr:thiamine-phosphate kinase [Alteromonadaceae bacterium]
MKEFDLIKRYFAQGGHTRKDVLLGIGDDCAVTKVPENQHLAITTDTLISGVHFLPDAPARSVAYKAVAVNLSDLAAAGAEPAWISLSLSLPSYDEDWIDEFVKGLFELTEYYSVQLIGGDTVTGPLSLTITAQGFVPPNTELRRSTAKPGDWIYVTGHLGDAGAGLDILQGKVQASDKHRDYLVNRHYFPTPRVMAGTALRRTANACIDVSDGLVADLSHILNSSGCGATVHVDRLPVSSALFDTVGAQQAYRYALTAGDDYELVFAVNEEQRGNLETSLTNANVKATCIGQITGHAGQMDLRLYDEKYELDNEAGYEHRFTNG